MCYSSVWLHDFHYYDDNMHFQCTNKGEHDADIAQLCCVHRKSFRYFAVYLLLVTFKMSSRWKLFSLSATKSLLNLKTFSITYGIFLTRKMDGHGKLLYKFFNSPKIL